MTLPNRFNLWALFAAVALAAPAGVLASVTADGSLHGAQGRFWLGIAMVFGCAALAFVVLLRAEPPEPIDIRLAVAPVIVLSLVLSFLANGVGSILDHQLAWGLVGVGSLTLIIWQLGRRMIPLWLILFACALAVLSLAAGLSTTVLLNVALTAIVLFTAWHVAGTFSEPGGVARFLAYVAVVYWIVTFAAVIVGATHIPIGSMGSGNVQAPWASALGANKTGYGVISNQVGRLLTGIVCAYHLTRFRSAEHRWRHASFGLLAAVIFLFQYGRIPLVAGVIIVVLVLATGRQGTRVWIIAGLAAVAVFGLASVQSKSTGAFSLRLGASNWDSGHAAIWSQQITLFTTEPLTGVGLHPTAAQLYVSRTQPVFPRLQTLDSGTSNPVVQAALQQKGSRGEGGWTGTLAQTGAVGTGFVVALIALAFMDVFSPMRNAPPEGIQDRILLRAILTASLLVYVTDLQPLGFTTLPDYVVLQLTMIAAVTALKSRARN